MCYNLLKENWIPVFYHNGDYKRIGILKTLTEAGEIRQVSASNPMDNVAILRFLLALLYWCKGNPPEDLSDLPKGSFPQDWFNKLEEQGEYFNLLGEGKRFYQDRNAKRSRPAKDLLQEIPTGNNFWHFLHSVDGKDGLCPACCTLGLLRLPLFTTLGGRAIPYLYAGINGAPPTYLFKVGNSLSEALKANWIYHENLGHPSWERNNITQTKRTSVSLLEGLTFLPRLVWFGKLSENAICINCGAKGEMIVNCEYQSSGKSDGDAWNDPHVIYYYDDEMRKADRTPNLLSSGMFRMDRPWSKMLERIATGRKTDVADKSESFLIVGFATDKAKNIDVWERKIELPPMELNSESIQTLLNLWQKEGWRMGKRMGRSKVSGTATISSIRPHIEHKVSSRIDELLTGEEDTWKEASDEYRPMMESVSKSLSPGFTTKDVRRRQQIANTLPDMSIKEETVSETKKGGE